MTNEQSPYDDELYRRVDEVMHYLWDPPGVSAVPMVRDEYESYIPVVYKLVRDGESEKAIAKYLGRIEKNHLGLTSDLDLNAHIAEVLVEWRETIAEKYDKSRQSN